jgi:hypothetical protein
MPPTGPTVQYRRISSAFTLRSDLMRAVRTSARSRASTSGYPSGISTLVTNGSYGERCCVRGSRQLGLELAARKSNGHNYKRLRGPV